MRTLLDDIALLRSIAQGLHGGGFYRDRKHITALADNLQLLLDEPIELAERALYEMRLQAAEQHHNRLLDQR